MILCYLKYKWKKHLLLGTKIGEGSEHIVFAKGDYVYKVRDKKTSNPIDFIEYVIDYLKRRNCIPFQIPCKFAGIVFLNKHFYPVFKQQRIEPMTLDMDTFYKKITEYIDMVPLGKNQYLNDVRLANFGVLNGELKAFDVSIKGGI